MKKLVFASLDFISILWVLVTLFYLSITSYACNPKTELEPEEVPFPLVEHGHARAVIVVTDDAAAAVLETAQDISRIIGKITGAKLPVVTQVTAGLMLILGVQELDRSLAPLEYHVWRNGDTLYFSGGADQGVINGVYAFLSQELGCRWYTPDKLGEYIPKRKSLAVGAVNMQDKPDFESVGGFGRHPDQEESRWWIRRNGLEGFPGQFHSHNWQNIVPWSNFEKHPEWFALAGDERSVLQICTTHPEVIAAAVDKARRYFDNGGPMYSLSPTDNMGFCRCDSCLALDTRLEIDPFAPGNSITDRLIYFCNQVAAEVEKTHPDRHLSIYAYLNHTEPPQVVKPHPMILPVLCHTPWDYCQHHPIADPDCERNRSFADAVKGWQKLSPKLYLYDYWGHYGWYGHFGLVHSIRKDLPWLRQHGVVGFFGEMHPQQWTQTLNIYLPARFAWDLNADVDAIVREFYEHMFGPAAPILATYGQIFEDLLANVPKGAQNDYERAFVHDMTPDFFRNVYSLLDSAEALIQNSKLLPEDENVIHQRLRRFRYGLRITQQQAIVKLARLHGYLDRASVELEKLLPILNEIEADPDLADMIELPAAKRQTIEEAERMMPYRRVWEDTNLSSERLAELRRWLDKGCNHEVASALGYITDWHVVGLWSNPGGNPLALHLPPEDGVRLSDTYQGRSGQIEWQPYRGKSPYGIVDLREYFYPQDTEYTTAFLYSELELGKETEARFIAVVDDDLVLWINDQLVYPPDSGPSSEEEIRVNVKLQRGKNSILAKVLNRQHGFRLNLRIIKGN